MESNDKNSKKTLILIVSLFIFGLIVIYNYSYLQLNNNNNSNNNSIQTKVVDNQIKKPLVNNSINSYQTQKPYLGDIHLQIGLSNLSYLKISLNNKIIFDSKSDNRTGNFLIQVFDATLIGKNKFIINYKDNDDSQPLVFFVIKDSSDTIYNWQPKDNSGENSFEVYVK